MRYDGVDWIILLLLFMLILTEGQAGETWENSEKNLMIFQKIQLLLAISKDNLI
jgi:hypothetical protein